LKYFSNYEFVQNLTMHDIVIYRFAKKMHLAPRILGFWNSRKISPRRSHPFSLGINNLQGSVRSSLVHRSFKYIRIIDLSARKSTARPTNHFNVYETIFTPFHLLTTPPFPRPCPFSQVPFVLLYSTALSLLPKLVL